ncbi:MAG TPA: SRPBCC family protein [Paucimonas sp.]|nr:SRPBCC family protein [Paucimonas sp.]
MARIQQSIDLGVPVHAAYQQLLRFEEYPHFMQEVDTVRRIDDTHLHWAANVSYQTLEWDAEIIEQSPDRCVAWRNSGGPIDAERIELQSIGPSRSRMTMTMECDPLQWIPAQDGNADQAVAERIREDLERFKAYVETHGAEASTMLRETRGMGAALQSGGTPAAETGYAAGSEGWSGGEDPSEPVKSASHAASEGPGWSGEPAAGSPSGQGTRGTQSDSLLSQSAARQSDDGRFGIAEEQNLDQQSDAARRVGSMPQPSAQDDAMRTGETDAAEAMRQSMKQRKREETTDRKPDIDRAAPEPE